MRNDTGASITAHAGAAVAGGKGARSSVNDHGGVERSKGIGRPQAKQLAHGRLEQNNSARVNVEARGGATEGWGCRVQHPSERRSSRGYRMGVEFWTGG